MLKCATRQVIKNTENPGAAGGFAPWTPTRALPPGPQWGPTWLPPPPPLSARGVGNKVTCYFLDFTFYAKI